MKTLEGWMRFFLIISLLFLWSSVQAAQTGQVVDNVRANVRSGKAEGYRVVTTLAPGTTVEVLKTEGGFAQIQTADGKTGWMASRLLKMTEAKDVPPSPVTTTSHNVQPAVSELEAARNQVRAAEAEAASARLEASRRDEQLSSSRKIHAWFALGGLIAGFLLGMLVRELQYRRRLHGLRV